MSLTPSQLTIIKNYILSVPALAAQPNNSDGNFFIANALNQIASPNYWVWATDVSREDVYNTTSDLATTWNWTTYKNQSVTEQNAWTQIFMGDQANFAQLNVRVGIGSIFTGSAAANNQRDHCLNVGRRLATVVEKLLSTAVVNPPANTGNNAAAALGGTTNPAVMGFEGNISSDEVEAARNS